MIFVWYDVIALLTGPELLLAAWQEQHGRGLGKAPDGKILRATASTTPLPSASYPFACQPGERSRCGLDGRRNRCAVWKYSL